MKGGSLVRTLAYKSWGDYSNDRIVVCYQYAGGTEAGYPDEAFDQAVYSELVNVLADVPGEPYGVGLVPVTNRVPEVHPWNVIFAVVLGRGNPGWRNSGGQAKGRVARTTDPDQFTQVVVGWNPNPTWLALLIAHECGHALCSPDAAEMMDPVMGDHESGPGIGGAPNLMSPSGPLTGARMSAKKIEAVRREVTRHQAGVRFGCYLPPQGGTPAFGWGTVGKVSFF